MLDVSTLEFPKKFENYPFKRLFHFYQMYVFFSGNISVLKY